MKMKKKLLIVDDDKFIVSILVEKLKQYEDIDILKAYSYKEGLHHVISNKKMIHAAIIDLNLPDTKDGEMANFTLSKKIPTVILTGKYDKSIESKLLKYNTLDFIVKNGNRGINNSISSVRRALNNYDTNVLVVDDSNVQRNILEVILTNMKLKVKTVKSGQEALEIVKNFDDEFSLVFTDYNMPKMDGMELVAQLRELYDKDKLGIIALSSNEKQEVISEFIKLGANDYISKPYSSTEVITRVNSILNLLDLFKENREMAFKDYLTNTYNRRYFFNNGEIILEKAKRLNHNIAIAMIDIDEFKSINDNFGHDIGDIALIQSAKILKDAMRHSDLIARFGGEEFCILLENVSLEDTKQLFEKIRILFEKNIIKYNDLEINFTISIGICYGIPSKLHDMLKLADNSLYKSKRNGKNQTTIYTFSN
jgi:diguanylate cyclase (GGDEF)-like protein